MKVAILGTWHVHAPAYAKEAQRLGEVVGVYEEDPERCANFARELGIPAFGSREALLASGAEGVIVCSATKRHTEDILAALQAGLAVFTEKVLALTVAECEKIRAEVRKRNARFVISFPWKCKPGVLALREIAESGELGRLNYIRVRNCHNGSIGNWLPPHFYNAAECGGGAMIDLGAHGMYLTDMFHGLPETYRSGFGVFCNAPAVKEKNRDGVEDNAVTVMTYADGCIAVNETGFVSLGYPETVELGGERGMAVMNGEAPIRKITADTGMQAVEVPLPAALPSPLTQFMTGEILPGFGIDEAVNLTAMMEGAYRV